MISVREPIALLRSLNGSAARCLLALLMSPQPLTNTRLAQLTGSSRNSVAAAMGVLFDLGFAERVGLRTGWRLTKCAVQTFSPAQLQEAGTLPIGQVGESPSTEGDAFDAYRAQSAIQEGGGGGLIKLINISPPPPESSRHQDNALAARSEGSSGQSEPHQRASPPSHAHQAQVEAILGATPLLFGERLHGPPERYHDPNLLLAWIADCYTRRHSLNKPARVAYSNLENGLIPAERFRRDPLRHLPTRFLRKAGLPLPRDRLAGDPEAGALDQNEIPRSPPLDSARRHASLDTPLERANGRTPSQVWELAFGTLRQEMPHSLYQRWVRPVRLERCDSEKGAFLAAVPDEESRLWLQDHLRVVLEKRLEGYCGPGVQVFFTPTSDPGD